MPNHFHVLVEVGRKPEQSPDDEELLARIASTHVEGAAAQARFELTT
jgi:hypothetical protein